jgi:hypothetical protein
MWLLHFAAWPYIRGKQNQRRSIATDIRTRYLAFYPHTIKHKFPSRTSPKHTQCLVVTSIWARTNYYIIGGKLKATARCQNLAGGTGKGCYDTYSFLSLATGNSLLHLTLETILDAGNNNLTTVSKNKSWHICGPKSWENEWETPNSVSNYRRCVHHFQLQT